MQNTIDNLKELADRATHGQAAIDASRVSGATAESIFKAYLLAKHGNDSVDPIELSDQVGDLLADVLHAMRAKQCPTSLQEGIIISAQHLILTPLITLNEIMSAYVEAQTQELPDYMFRAFGHFQAEQEACINALDARRRGAA